MTITSTSPTTAPGRSPSSSARHFGKYRGTVNDNQDPRNQGRLKVEVPEILGDVVSGWALPCLPYAGDKSGVYTVPAVGSGVWVEFEAGDVSRPIWVGCWWQSDKIPEDEGGAQVTPDVRTVRSEEGLLLAFHDDNKTIALSDSDGSNQVVIDAQGGKVTIKASSKVVVDAPQIQLVDGATHAGVFGDQLNTYLQQLVLSINTHMHPGQQAGPFPVTPMTPTPPAQTPTPDLLSTKVTLG
jgi:uncharacterized protein involved in type VI secretion and phage assembly